MRIHLASLVLLFASTAVADEPDPHVIKVDGATLKVGFKGDQSEKLDSLELSLERAGKQVWKVAGWKAISGGKPIPKTFDSCESFDASMIAQKLEKKNGARLDVACRNGEDMFSASAVAVLIDSLDPYTVLWTGESNTVHSENGACVDEHLVSYTLKGKTLTAKVTDSTLKNKDGSCQPDRKPGKAKVKKSTQTIKL